MKTSGNRRRLWLTRAGLLVASCGITAGSGLVQAQGVDGDFAEFSLEDLLAVEVVSPGKRTQRLADVPAAIHVITSEDIRRSGAQSLPEALRLAPGVEVSFISGDRWAVSIRGFSEYLSNKLMVLVDGRSAYSPNFSGVFWNTLQLPLKDIDRIEVIRGPGGSIWGANAVNGVINIITKPSSDRLGTEVGVAYGDRMGGRSSIRHGFQVDETTYASGYVTGRRGPVHHADFVARKDDTYEHLGAGFRIDGQGSRQTWMVAGNAFRVDSPSVADIAFNPPGALVDDLPDVYFGQVVPSTDEFTGINLQAQLKRPVRETSELEINASYVHEDLEPGLLATGTQDIFDVEAQYRTRFGERVGWIMGGGYRHFRDSIEPNGLVTAVSEPEASLDFFSLFAEADTSLTDDVRLILGSRLDYNEYTDAEFQPTARLLWNLSPRHSLWAAASQAKRIPSRGERVVTMDGPAGFAPEPPDIVPRPARIPFPLSTKLLSSNDFGTETLTAFEIGYRGQTAPALFLDATAYLHRYRDLRTIVPDYDLSRLPEIGVEFDNSGELSVAGLELSADWRPTPDLRLQALVAFSDIRDSSLPDTGNPIRQFHVSAFAPPERSASLRASLNLTPSVDLDLWLRHVSERTPGVLPLERQPDDIYLDVRNIPLESYTTLDARIAWRPAPRTEIALIGQNLLDDTDRYELAPLLPRTLPSPVRRGVLAVFKHEF